MDTLVKADIFFFIASIATVVLTILIAILLCYLIRAGKNLHAISVALKSNYKESEAFIQELKERLEHNFVFQFFFPPVRAKKRVLKK